MVYTKRRRNLLDRFLYDRVFKRYGYEWISGRRNRFTGKTLLRTEDGDRWFIKTKNHKAFVSGL